MFNGSYNNLVQATTQLIAFNILFFAILIIFLWTQRQYQSRIQSKYNTLIGILIILFCVFAFYDSDWFSYLAIFKNYDYFSTDSFEFTFEHLFAKEGNSHMETIYNLFVNFSYGNYLVFRLYIWGLACVLLAFTAKRLEVGTSAFYIIFSTCFLLVFCYGRVSLAYSLAFLGFSFIVKPTSRRLFSMIIGFFLMLISMVFHKTALFMIPVIFLSLLPFNKKTITFYILLSIPLVFLLNSLPNYINMLDAEDNLAMSNLQIQVESTKGVSFSGSIIRNIISKYLVYLPYYIFFFGIIHRAKNGSLQVLPHAVRCMASAACWIIFISSILLLVNQYMMFYRSILYAIIPMSITLASLYINSSKPDKMVNSILYFGLIFSSYKLAYVFYLSIVN